MLSNGILGWIELLIMSKEEIKYHIYDFLGIEN